MKRNHYGRNRRYEDASTVRDTNVNITDTGTESTLGIWSSSHCCKSGFAVKLKISGINPTCVQSSKPVPAGMAIRASMAGQDTLLLKEKCDHEPCLYQSISAKTLEGSSDEWIMRLYGSEKLGDLVY